MHSHLVSFNKPKRVLEKKVKAQSLSLQKIFCMRKVHHPTLLFQNSLRFTFKYTVRHISFESTSPALHSDTTLLKIVLNQPAPDSSSKSSGEPSQVFSWK